MEKKYNMRWEISFVPLSCFFFSIFFQAAGPSLVMCWIIGDSWCSNRGFWSLWYEIPAIHNCWRTTWCLWSQIFHVLQRWGVRANPIIPQSLRLSHSASLLPKHEMLKVSGKRWWKNNVCLLQAELLQPFIFVQTCYWRWWHRSCWPNVRHQPKFTALHSWQYWKHCGGIWNQSLRLWAWAFPGKGSHWAELVSLAQQQDSASPGSHISWTSKRSDPVQYWHSIFRNIFLNTEKYIWCGGIKSICTAF